MPRARPPSPRRSDASALAVARVFDRMVARLTSSVRDNPGRAGSAPRRFWGSEGAGVLPMAADTGRVLVGLRSDEVNEPGTWGTWGGATRGVSDERDEDDPAAGAVREFCEEAGWCDEHVAVAPLYVFERLGFRFRNFLLVVPREFEPVLNWEHDDARWVDLGAVPEPMHFGLRALLADPASAAALRRVAAGRRGRK